MTTPKAQSTISVETRSCVEIDMCEVWDKINDETIRKECIRRNLALGPVSNDREKRSLLLSASDALRAHGHNNLAFRLDELRDEIGC